LASACSLSAFCSCTAARKPATQSMHATHAQAQNQRQQRNPTI
jgi:hypothetical protein